uniref:(northern house mosquito) hypothetical protein n=1 Tax=Culex pipiens TaxID=7175 RepID=A0A8D8N223_CULPI
MSVSEKTALICSNVSRRKSSRFCRVRSIRSISRFTLCLSRFLTFSMATRMSCLFIRRRRLSSAFRCLRSAFCSGLSFCRLMRCCRVCRARLNALVVNFFSRSSGLIRPAAIRSRSFSLSRSLLSSAED